MALELFLILACGAIHIMCCAIVIFLHMHDLCMLLHWYVHVHGCGKTSKNTVFIGV